MNKIRTLLKDLDNLNLPEGSFVIGGSGPMGIRDLREVDDLDVIVKKEVFDKLKRESRQDTSGHKYGHLEFGEIEIGYTWQDSEEKAIKVINDSELIEGYPFAKFKYVVEWKKEMNRDKDQKDIKLISEYLDHQK